MQERRRGTWASASARADLSGKVHYMKRTTFGVRLALLVVISAAMLVALPATALAAKTTTRIVVSSSRIVNHDTATTNLWPITITAKLQKKSGSRYVALKSGTVKLYLYNDATRRYEYKSSPRSSSTGVVTLTIPRRGKYKLYYAGSSTMKACTGYTTIKESIGVVLSAPLVSLNYVSGTSHLVQVGYDVTWNTAAWDGTVLVCSENQFQDATTYYASNYVDAYVDHDREVASPRVVLFQYLVDATEFEGLGYVGTFSRAYTWDSYIVTPGAVESSFPITG